jgi:hypothetical protein
MSTRNNIINILNPVEKQKFIVIKQIFDKPEDRTIYLRLLYVILANSKSSKKERLGPFFEQILQNQDDITKVHQLLNNKLKKFIPDTLNTSHAKYIVSGKKIYEIPQNSLPANASKGVYTRPIKGHNFTMKNISSPIYNTISNQKNRNNENDYENADVVLGHIIKSSLSNSGYSTIETGSNNVFNLVPPELPPRNKVPIHEIDLDNVIGRLEKQIRVYDVDEKKPVVSTSPFYGGSRKRTKKTKRTKRHNKSKK